MGSFMDAVTAYPTAVFTVLLLVVLGYWLLALLGLVDFDALGGDLEMEVRADLEGVELGTVAGYVVAMGLNGVPFSIVISLLVLVGWTLSSLAGQWLMPLVPAWPLQWLVGTGVLLLSLALAVLVTARLIRPMRGLFVTHQAQANQSLLGRTCRVMSLRVDEHQGHALVAQRGANLNIRVHADTPNTLTKGSTAYILEYDEGTGRYLIQAED
jgi:hypothetical protein